MCQEIVPRDEVISKGLQPNLNIPDGTDARPPGSPSCVKVTGAQQQTVIANVRHHYPKVGRAARKSMRGMRHLGARRQFAVTSISIFISGL